ncbi:MAG: SUMF1/EgtB/PvdO family nonheme iron enzyme, partial [Actinomycetota bacterium]
LANILDKMVCDHFSQRYQNAAEALQALAPLLPSTPSLSNVSTVVVATAKRFSKPSPRQSASPPTINLSTFFFEIITVNARGEITNRQPGKAEFYQENLGKGVSLEMVAIPGGTFLMGSPETEAERYDNEGPQNEVKIPPFFMGKYPVTQAQWQAVMGNNPSKFQGVNRPVEQVSWKEATEFCRKLSQRTGRNYKLPSEAEWEYACRAGTTTPFYFGETMTTDLVNYNGNYPCASAPKGIYREQTTEVGSFPPNGFGLFDMHGNVWEWCQDTWHENYNGAPTDGSAWETGGDSQYRLLRGGSWNSYPADCRSAFRYHYAPDVRYDPFGFRLVCAVAWTP